MKKEKFQIAAYKPHKPFKFGNTLTDGNFMIKLEVIKAMRKAPSWSLMAMLGPDKQADTNYDCWQNIRGNHEIDSEAVLSTRAEIAEGRIYGMLIHSDTKYAIIQYGFYRFFKEMFPYCTFHIEAPKKPVIVKSGGEEIGLFMPIEMSKNYDYSWLNDDPSFELKTDRTKETVEV